MKKITCSATSDLKAQRFNSSCFSNSCLTALALTFAEQHNVKRLRLIDNKIPGFSSVELKIHGFSPVFFGRYESWTLENKRHIIECGSLQFPDEKPDIENAPLAYN
uniref:Uncharacterized protein n=1 Tax=Romanomermis culicivorax TaxID=13658 RepID=A0A915KAY1_ROMCU